MARVSSFLHSKAAVLVQFLKMLAKKEHTLRIGIMFCSLIMSVAMGLSYAQGTDPALWFSAFIIPVLPAVYLSYLLVDTIGEMESAIKSLQKAEESLKDAEESLKDAEAILRGEKSVQRESISAMLRRSVMKRSGTRCFYCGGKGDKDRDSNGQTWHVDHVVAVTRGGPTRLDNLVLSCQRCNLRKGNKPFYQFADELIQEERKKA